MPINPRVFALLRRAAQISAWSLLVAIVLVTLGPVADRPQLGHPQLERFAAFAALAGAFGLAYPKRWRLGAFSLCVLAVALEVGQLFVPGRDAGLPDALAKVAGAAAGALVARLGALAVDEPNLSGNAPAEPV